MSNVIDEARKRFQDRNKGKTTSVQATLPPIVRLHNKEGKTGAYLSGILDGKHEVTIGKKKPQLVFNFKLIETNASITKKDPKASSSAKGKDKYMDVEAAKGDLVSIFAPTRLARVLNDVSNGAEVFLEYKGREPFTNNEGITTEPHIFYVEAGGVPLTVGKKDGSGGDDDFE